MLARNVLNETALYYNKEIEIFFNCYLAAHGQIWAIIEGVALLTRC